MITLRSKNREETVKMHLSDIQNLVKKCRYYASGSSEEHACQRSQFIANTCFAFENRAIPDTCSYFPVDNKITEAKIDTIWK